VFIWSSGLMCDVCDVCLSGLSKLMCDVCDVCLSGPQGLRVTCVTCVCQASQSLCVTCVTCVCLVLRANIPRIQNLEYNTRNINLGIQSSNTFPDRFYETWNIHLE